MITTNEGFLDRALRSVLAAVLLYVSLGGLVGGTVGGVLMVLAALLLVTGLVGWCPLYSLLGIHTLGRRHRGTAA